MASLHLLVYVTLVCYLTPSTTSKNHDRQSVAKVDGANGPLLLNELLLDYDSFARPASTSEPTRVQVSLVPGLVLWKDDQLQTALTLEQTWIDERLKFVGNTQLKLDDTNSRLWLPDTVFHNSLETRHTSRGLITIQPQGLIHWVQQLLVMVPCPLEPSEVWSSDGVVSCTLVLSSRGYTGGELEYLWSHDSPSESPKVDGSSQLRKLKFVGDTVEKAASDPFNATMNESIIAALNEKHLPELKVILTVQTDFTKSVLRYLTKKAMKDL